MTRSKSQILVVGALSLLVLSACNSEDKTKAEAMGGHLRLGPELADGAEFLLLLPAAHPLP